MIASRTRQSTRTKLLGGLFVLAGLLAIGVAWYAQNRLLLAPCELCLWERRPWRYLIALGVLTFALPPRYARWPLAAGLACIGVSIGLAILHAGVEHGFWPSPAPECRAPAFHGGGFKDWMASMPARPNKPCDSPDYLYGLPISMTETGGLYALVVFVVAAAGSVKVFRSRRA
ncbi:disulfide bond formation protein B [Gluconobacter wancherniae]|uniref:disulfide bond formation protein B n=1 Tax=Gluconobacter wancherniae TaxID=1307955 RepID=UPI001B8C88D8|nr:disulfide bond formation protein B [Gluconobacter wancherniae]MBS1062937.1 disulfide bond formation protein B [Gluconobacter wancherniae]MBS1089644.1 disulfide bond formation protein B [Gluconobacter wancherniae]